eukprot:TRINITY_DN1130_c0_g1_i1.p1 TRINITY_DN1130_c0_g1~~TRINITY_DN1130_c0_g1_i1.p1  ORF type:complete len:542 (+),score=163.40 TRINITY_DN1130_c0_g1_i1:188-1813(+)
MSETSSKRAKEKEEDDDEEEGEEEEGESSSSELSESDEDEPVSGLAARILAAKGKRGSGVIKKSPVPENDEDDEDDDDDDDGKKEDGDNEKGEDGIEPLADGQGVTKKKKKKGMIRFEGQEELPGNDTAADEEAEKYKGTVDPNDDDKNRCIGFLQPQNAKGQIWKYPVIKQILPKDDRLWFSVRRNNFAFLSCMDINTGVLSTPKPMKWEWPPVWLAADESKNRVYVSDIRRAFRWTDMNSKSLKENYAKDSSGYLDASLFLFDEEGNLFLSTEPNDHKTFAVTIYKVSGDVWKPARKMTGHSGRISFMCWVGKGAEQRLWTCTRNGEIGIWNRDGTKVKIITDAHKAKRSCHCLATDGEFVYSGGSDKRVYKWSLAGDRIKRFIIRKHIYALAARKQFLYIGLENGDIQIRNPLGQVVAIFKPPPKAAKPVDENATPQLEPGSVAAAKEKEKARRARGKGKRRKGEEGKHRKYVRQIVFSPTDENILYTVQPNYHCVLKWNIAGIDKLKYSGSIETAPVYFALKEANGPYIPETLCSIS